MKVVVIGGSGLIGSNLVGMLREKGVEVIAASPSSGVNAVTGEGLAEVLAGAQVVVDVTNSPSFEDNAVMEFFQASTRNLLAAVTAAGVGHYVALSVVGTERMLESGYFRAKMAQEKMIIASGRPYTIVRATQFYEFVMGIAHASADGQQIRLPSAKLQPIAAVDVAKALADVVLSKPVNGQVEVAGPQKLPLYQLVDQVLRARQDGRVVIKDEQASYFGVRINDRSLTPEDDARICALTLDQWLAAAAVPA